MTNYAYQAGLWTAAAFGCGLALVVTIAAIAAGYILGGFILGRAGRTVMGTHIRHFFARIAPAKRFHSSDYDYVRHIVSCIQSKAK